MPAVKAISTKYCINYDHRNVLSTIKLVSAKFAIYNNPAPDSTEPLVFDEERDSQTELMT